MKKLILIALLCLPNVAFAETWLCITEASAGITATKPFDSNVFKPDSKYLVTISDKVTLKEVGRSEWPLDCISNELEVSCITPQTRIGATFSLDKLNKRFWNQSVFTEGGEVIWIYSRSGACETIEE